MNKNNILIRQLEALENEDISTSTIESEVLNKDGRITKPITDLVLSKIEQSTFSKFCSKGS